ncbi:protein STAY-GREEN, chloroplastic [Selaginella moellendorffii]|nr:protein STAY-GREEN, chloroplastic [Selaginella moellendorffii]|eukprot:XP_002974181.2 protein STAY-GREEN, chloroplastic [Selaginella moellendorffii]
MAVASLEVAMSLFSTSGGTDSRTGLHRSKTAKVSQFLSSRSCQRLLLTSRQIRNASRRISPVVEARLFGPAIFEASKLKVLFLGEDHDKHPSKSPRTYTLTHSDITAKLTLAISREINKAQIMGWYSRLQRDEVLAEWKQTKGEMSLHVHCHISGGHWMLDAIAPLRFYIFRKELPVVLEAFRHGDEPLFRNHPELEGAMVWVYFHSNVSEYNKVECWGPLRNAAKTGSEAAKQAIQEAIKEIEKPWHSCTGPCTCCSRNSLIPVPQSLLEASSPSISTQSSPSPDA